MKDEVEAIGIEGGGIVAVHGQGVHLDGATYEAGRKEALAAGFPLLRCGEVSLFLGGIRSNQKPYVLRQDEVLIGPIVQYLCRRGENEAALSMAMLV